MDGGTSDVAASVCSIDRLEKINVSMEMMGMCMRRMCCCWTLLGPQYSSACSSLACPRSAQQHNTRISKCVPCSGSCTAPAQRVLLAQTVDEGKKVVRSNNFVCSLKKGVLYLVLGRTTTSYISIQKLHAW